MRRKSFISRKNENKGFTLVELIIAVAILAIIIFPLIANFVQSSKLNLKGRKSLNAMNLAQDVMEGISAYSASNFDQVMQNADASNLTGLVLPSATKGYTLPGSGFTGAKDDSSTAENRIYKLNGVKTADGNYNEYDITIKVDASTDSSGNLVKYNSESVAEIAEIDQYYDAIYTVPTDDVDQALAEPGLKMTGVADSSYYGKLARTIDITIDNKGTAIDNQPYYWVEVTRTYNVASDTATLGTGTASLASGNISKAASTVKPRAVYLYFEGIQGATYGNNLETINVYNRTGESIDVYLIRTQDATTYDSDYNLNFGCHVNIITSDPDKNASGDIIYPVTLTPSTATSDSTVNLITNLRFNLDPTYTAEQNVRTKEEKTGNAIAGVTAPATNGYMSERAVFTYNSTNSVDETFYEKYISDGYKKVTKNMLYNVTIEINEAGTSNTVGTYTGGIYD